MSRPPFFCSACAAALLPALFATPLSWPAAAPPEQSSADAATAGPDPPQVLFRDLFAAVQHARIFADGKAFPDAVPRLEPRQILSNFDASHPHTAQQLQAFVDQYFEVPVPATVSSPDITKVPITAHIDALWNQLTRTTTVAPRFGSLLALPHPYVVPGGRFRELYYWDSYFTMLGLQASGRQDLVADMVNDFAFLIDAFGHVPNGTRTYYLSRSQPPFFFEMVGLLSRDDPASGYARYLRELRREYAFWMAGERGLPPGTAYMRVVSLPDGAILNRYWDNRDTPRDESFLEDSELSEAGSRPSASVYRNIRAAAESGWDFSSRWFADGKHRTTINTTDIIPVDLNALLYGLEDAIRLGCKVAHDRACTAEFAARMHARRTAIDRYLWDAAHGVYFDYRWPAGERITRISAATLYPLFEGAASNMQARAVGIAVSAVLLQPGGLVTTTVATGEQWDAPNGWAPLQWIAISGLRRYGDTALANSIACRWMNNVSAVYRDGGKLVEKYDVIDTSRAGGGGEYPTQDGFGWTNGVMRRLAGLYPARVCSHPPTVTTRCRTDRPCRAPQPVSFRTHRLQIIPGT